ncbi:MAG TPA: excinuclease ABC subunit UvrA, partial [Spirochaetota bacterium]|nr:excinuclease ABC subunit UvrA [Spirochaetota bacterium]
MAKKIVIRGAREHNLKNVDIAIPRDRFTVITGVSGSGKSSLAFDTLYAEGQRRYVESLSSYARQFLGQMEKPAVDAITGLSPAIAIEQKTSGRNPRSTVGTITEIYDYLRLLFARAGRQYCSECGCPVGSRTLDQVVAHILHTFKNARLLLMAPVVKGRKGAHEEEISRARQEGYSRLMINGRMHNLGEKLKLDKNLKYDIDIIVDRI